MDFNDLKKDKYPKASYTAKAHTSNFKPSPKTYNNHNKSHNYNVHPFETPNYSLDLENYKFHQKNPNLQNQDPDKPKFHLHYRNPSHPQSKSLDRNTKNEFLKKRMEYDMEMKKELVQKMKESRQKKKDLFLKPVNLNFIDLTKQRIKEREKKQEVDWEKKLYSYSAQKEKHNLELVLKKNYLKKQKEELKKKKSKSKKQLVVEKLMDDIKKTHKKKKITTENFNDDKISQKNENKKNKFSPKKNKSSNKFSPKKNKSSHKKDKKNEKDKKNKKSQDKKNEDFDINEENNKIQRRALDYQNFLRSIKIEKEKAKREKSKNLLKIQKKAKSILEKCKKKPFIPKEDFNDANYQMKNPVMIEEEQIFKKDEYFEENQQIYKEKKIFVVTKPKKNNETKIIGKPVKAAKILKELKKNNFQLYKYPKELRNEEDEEEIRKVEKLTRQNPKNLNNKTTKVDNMNKVLNEAKIRNVPKNLLEKEEFFVEREEENVIEKSLRDFKEERNRKKEKNFKEKPENQQEDDLRFMNFANPIKEYQKELSNELNIKTMKKTKNNDKNLKSEKDFKNTKNIKTNEKKNFDYYEKFEKDIIGIENNPMFNDIMEEFPEELLG